MSVATALGVGSVVDGLRVREAWLVDPISGRQGPGAIAVDGGVVTELRWADGPGRTSDADGAAHALVVAPAFLDLAAHLREPGGEDAETFATGLAAAAHGGFGAVCAMPDTRPTVDRTEVVQRIVAAAAGAGVPIAFRTWAAMSGGREGTSLGSLASLAAAGVTGFTDAPAPTVDPALLRAALTEAGALGLPVMVHADEPTLTKGAEANEGLPATILGLHGAPAAAEVSAVSRAIAVLRQVAAEVPPDSRPHLHLSQLSSAGSLEPLRAARAEGLRVTADVAPHHLALHDGWLGGDRRWSWEAASTPWSGGAGDAAPYAASVRVDPPLRGPDDAIALLAALEEGVVDAVASHHAPARSVDKEVPFGEAVPGISGVETTLALVLAAVDAGRLGLVRAIRALTIGPWRAIDGGARGLPEPVLREGAEANLVVFDRAATWTVGRGTMLTRGLTTPLLGRSLPGRVALTVARGRVAWSDPEAPLEG